jgi:DNA-binding transcriptional MerR regulator
MLFIVLLWTMNMPKTINHFPTAQAARLSGLTPMMLDYLCRVEVLVPSQPGRRKRGCPRKYSFGDVVILRALARLLQAGVSVQRLKLALRSLRKHHKDISPTSLPAQYLVTDGRRVYLHERDTLREMDGSNQMAFMFVLELSQVRREVLRAASGG